MKVHSMIKKMLLLILMLIVATVSCHKEPIDDGNMLSIGVFGGSVSSSPESEAAKKMWKDNLNVKVKITTCGKNGMGFSSLTSPQYNIPMQIAEADTFDIYVLWASTNDVQCPIGDIGTRDSTTQSGGLLRSIDIIKQKNNEALILLFTSLPRFDSQTVYNKLPELISAQKAFCEQYSIPYLDQWSLCGFDTSNYIPYYFPDNIHLTVSGYERIAPMQVDFLQSQIQNHFEEKIEEKRLFKKQ